MPARSLQFLKRPVSYAERLAPRPEATIDLVVVHCTELPDLLAAREYGERIHYAESRTGNCGHYYIDRDGSVQQWVGHARTAHHVRGYNERSLGIELVNSGRFPNWLDSRFQRMSEPYPDAQIGALVGLLRDLRTALPRLRWISGHEDLDMDTVQASDDPALQVRRKRDPGPLFPWPAVLAGSGLERFAGQAKEKGV